MGEEAESFKRDVFSITDANLDGIYTPEFARLNEYSRRKNPKWI